MAINNGLKRLAASACLAVCAAIALPSQAAVIVNTNTTTDTGQGLEFLHIPAYTATSDYATALAGISLLGYNWQLATVDQFIALMSNATGVSVPAWNGSNLGDFDFSSSQADAMMAALGYGSSSITDGPWVWLNGESFGPAEFAAHTSCCDDFHLNQTTGTDINTAFYVRSIASVPAPASIALLGLGLVLVSLKRRNELG